jgi:hypothetical protein
MPNVQDLTSEEAAQLNELFNALPPTKQCMAIAEGVMQAVTSFPDILVKACAKAAIEICQETEAAYFNGKRKGVLRYSSGVTP